MAKESGLGFSVIVDDSGSSARTISNDITNLDFATPREEQDITGLDGGMNEPRASSHRQITTVCPV